MQALQRSISVLFSWSSLVMVALPLNLMAVLPVLFAYLGLGMLLLLLAGANVVVAVAPGLLDRADLIKGPFNYGNPENQ